MLSLEEIGSLNKSYLFEYLCTDSERRLENCQNATNFSHLYEDYDVTELPTGVETQVIPSFYLLLLLLGLPGNSLVVYVVLRHGPMKTVTNLLLMNLAFSDLLFLCFCVPFFVANFITNDWTFGAGMCKYFVINIQL